MTAQTRRVVLIGVVLVPFWFASVFQHRVIAGVLLAILILTVLRTVPFDSRLVEPDWDDPHWICLGAPLRTRKGTVWVCPDCDRSYVDTGWRWLEQERVTS